MSVRVTLCPTCGKQTGMYESGRSDSIAANKCECHPPTDPTPTQTRAINVFGGPMKHLTAMSHEEMRCELAEYRRLAALAATGDAPLSAEEVERAAREIVDDLFPDYQHADGGVGRSYQNMVIERLTSALGSVRPILCGTLAAQLATARAEVVELRRVIEADTGGVILGYIDDIRSLKETLGAAHRAMKQVCPDEPEDEGINYVCLDGEGDPQIEAATLGEAIIQLDAWFGAYQIATEKREQAARAERDALREKVQRVTEPYLALLLDHDSRKWIAPEIWFAIEQAVKGTPARPTDTGRDG